MAEQVSPETAALEVHTPQGEAVTLGTLWQERPALLVLVRHFGCQFCRAQLADLRRVLPDIRATGVQPIVIGNGTPPMAQAFVEETGLDVPLYTNPGREVYEALGARRPGAGALLNPRLWWNGLRVALRGFLPRKVQGDSAQLGGVFLVRPDGQMPYAYRSDLAGDHPSDAELRRAVGAMHEG
ncbi:MAG: AhpC/TSA family protein [Dehalococcoidia bacterium]|nr:AhpC/TSA family protein [Dehalococcoidia bacterium]